MGTVLGCLVTAIGRPDAATTPSCLPAIVLGAQTGPGGMDSDLAQLVRRGWAYAEPPLRLTQIAAAGTGTDAAPARSVLLTPCRPPDRRSLARLNGPPRSRTEWSHQVRELGRRCAVVLALGVDLHAADLADQLNRQASRGRVVWMTARIAAATPAPPGRPMPASP